MLPSRAPLPASARAEAVGALRRMLARAEGLEAAEPARLSFGLPTLDDHLPHRGLALGALHEIAPEREADLPAALGFLAALLARAPATAPLLLIQTTRALARNGSLSGHGLNALGLDPARLILVEAASETEALWATEEALRSQALAAVASTLGPKLDLKTSQRLQIVARDTGRPLLVLRPPAAEEAATATTRWRIAATEAARDHFGLMSRWRWHTRLTRCRNGQPGNWVLEYDHATHRFRLAASLAHRTVSEHGSPRASEHTD